MHMGNGGFGIRSDLKLKKKLASGPTITSPAEAEDPTRVQSPAAPA